MIAVLDGSPVPRSILMVSDKEGGAMILAFLVGISVSLGLVLSKNRPIYKSTSTIVARKRSHCPT